MYSIIITGCSVVMFAAAIVYFYCFSRNQERYLQFWGMGWAAYACSLFSLLLFLQTDHNLFLEIRKIVDMFNLLLLLFGSYSFMHRRIPAYWYRFSLYLLLLAGICIIYGFDLLSFYLPISVYQLILTVFICANVIRRWEIDLPRRAVIAAAFFLWGGSKAVFSILEIFTDLSGSFLLAEVLMSNMLNLCILTVCLSRRGPAPSPGEDIYRTVIEHTRGALFYYRRFPEPAFTYVSPSIREMTGYEPNDFYVNPRLIFEMTAEPFAGDITDLFEGRLKRNAYPVLELYRRDGEKFWCEFSYSFLTPGRDGAAPAEAAPEEAGILVGMLRDVTNMKTAEVDQVNETRRRNILLSYISHELRTPITSIAGFLTAIQDGTLSSEQEKAEAMEIITSRTLTLKKLIDDLDQLSKFESNQFTFHYEAWSAGDAAQAMISRCLPDADSEGFRVHTEADLSYLSQFWIVVDLERIQQVFSNLVSNAIKYSGESRDLYLSFTVDEREDVFRVSVRDMGIGIQDSQLPHVFDRFYRVGYNNGADAAGRGLGLTLSKEIIEAHQGEIFAESQYGSGSTFTFTIPLYQEG